MRCLHCSKNPHKMGFKVFEIGWRDGRRFPDPGSKS